jgi:hypothetical protein
LHVGFTFYDEHHLWFVITTPNHDDEVVMVNATDIANEHPDTTCIVTPADHPSLTLPESVIFYQKAQIYVARNFHGSIKQGRFRPKEPASDELIMRIRKGALDSEFTPGEAADMVLRCHWKPASGRQQKA